jgi:hypothetical protein
VKTLQTRGAVPERERILAEYARREIEIDPDRYAPWQPGETFMRSGMTNQAVAMLHAARVFPRPGDRCLEIGYGALGWLGVLISWGVQESRLAGIELNPRRATVARAVLPVADLRVGDATSLPWPAESYRLVIASTVFTSILDEGMRRTIAGEITRVLAPGGALLWYDFAVNNPHNPNVRGVSRGEVQSLFPDLAGAICRTTLAPPLARALAPISWTLANVLEAIPRLRTHLMAVLCKPLHP